MSAAQAKTKEKRKQKAKAGKVIRIDGATWRFLNQKRKANETIAALVARVVTGEERTKGTSYFILPNAGVVLKAASIAEARGQAIVLFVKRKSQAKERPVEVREIA